MLLSKFNYLEKNLNAVKLYENRIKDDPDYASSYISQGNAFYNLKRYLEAIECYSEVIKRDPNIDIYYDKKGNAFYNLKKQSNAMTKQSNSNQTKLIFTYIF
ncbi:unnamed protein product [Blepharisma stoltei]|uniref:Photosystem I assembly protein Ycf3 n=1 Tax=Blepharisma stoltei TaxID=1481888 RepID=A0AAU9IV11_9CILI|nr:unnamed protein product [Blepharisma stoltei]